MVQVLHVKSGRKSDQEFWRKKGEIEGIEYPKSGGTNYQSTETRINAHSN